MRDDDNIISAQKNAQTFFLFERWKYRMTIAHQMVDNYAVEQVMNELFLNFCEILSEQLSQHNQYTNDQQT